MFKELKDNIYSIGVLNPGLRVFDIIMRTEYGTTYNAYLVKGEKIALIETVHENSFEEYLENIESLINIKDIDYIVLNHTEPDHTGSVRKLLDLNPNITVISTAPGSKYVSGISNKKINAKIVKNDDTLDLGNGKVLKFIIAPFLHWPDSMFTYIENDKLLFSCDFLGAHYCEPRILDIHIKYTHEYDIAFKYYFDAIFGPFKKSVLDGLDKIKDLDIEMICTSHGPVLTKNIENAKSKYRLWCEEALKPNDIKKCLILYVSAYGYTKKLAEAAFKQLNSNNKYDINMINIIEEDISNIKEAIDKSDAIMIGSPTINRDALKPVWDVLSCVDAIINRGKPAAVFGSYGWSGEAVTMLKSRIESLGLKVVGDGLRITFSPDEDDIQKMKDYTKLFIKEIDNIN